MIEQILIENSHIQKICFAINPKNIASVKTIVKFCKSGQLLDYYEK